MGRLLISYERSAAEDLGLGVRSALEKKRSALHIPAEVAMCLFAVHEEEVIRVS